MQSVLFNLLSVRLLMFGMQSVLFHLLSIHLLMFGMQSVLFLLLSIRLLLFEQPYHKENTTGRSSRIISIAFI
jgi:hypothetical protein